MTTVHEKCISGRPLQIEGGTSTDAFREKVKDLEKTSQTLGEHRSPQRENPNRQVDLKIEGLLSSTRKQGRVSSVGLWQEYLEQLPSGCY